MRNSHQTAPSPRNKLVFSLGLLGEKLMTIPHTSEFNSHYWTGLPIHLYDGCTRFGHSILYCQINNRSHCRELDLPRGLRMLDGVCSRADLFWTKCGATARCLKASGATEHCGPHLNGQKRASRCRHFPVDFTLFGTRKLSSKFINLFTGLATPN